MLPYSKSYVSERQLQRLWASGAASYLLQPGSIASVTKRDPTLQTCRKPYGSIYLYGIHTYIYIYIYR